MGVNEPAGEAGLHQLIRLSQSLTYKTPDLLDGLLALGKNRGEDLPHMDHVFPYLEADVHTGFPRQ